MSRSLAPADLDRALAAQSLAIELGNPKLLRSAWLALGHDNRHAFAPAAPHEQAAGLTVCTEALAIEDRRQRAERESDWHMSQLCARALRGDVEALGSWRVAVEFEQQTGLDDLAPRRAARQLLATARGMTALLDEVNDGT